MTQTLLYCRPGFEGECAAEIQDQAAALGIHGYVRAKPDRGWLAFTPYDADAGARLAAGLDFRVLVFPRQLVTPALELPSLPEGERIGPLLGALEQLAPAVSGVWLETADTNAGKALQTLCRKLAVPLERALDRAGRLIPDNPALPRLHVLFLGGHHAWVGLSRPGNAAPWPMGIPRLKFPRAAPSRSTLKLEEALLWFLDDKERRRRLVPAMTAVDLGAAPGGWTWQLVRRHLRVTAVDNGPLDPALLDSGLVEHLRVDGFRYRPPRPVDWLVCDMVEQPARIAQLAANWLARGDCREAIFNLKLPMKKRYAELGRCRELIADTLADLPHRLTLKQLYHDREEVTAHLRRTSNS